MDGNKEEIVDMPPPTAPNNIPVTVRNAFNTEEEGREFAHTVAYAIRALSSFIKLEKLDGVTIAGDYDEALAEFDRGTGRPSGLTASNPDDDGVYGVAMAPAVMRDGIIKTHLFFNSGVLLGLRDPKGELFGLSLHTLSHECAHVEVTAAFDDAFPQRILRTQYSTALSGIRGDIIKAVWDEYAVTRICSTIGADPLPAYLQTFTEWLGTVDERVNVLVRAYRTNADLDGLLRKVLPLYSNLIKYAAYLLGTMDGREDCGEHQVALDEALANNWFKPYFERLNKELQTIWAQWGKWESMEAFDPIGDIAIEVFEAGGLILSENEEGEMSVNIPLRPDNTPNYNLAKAMGWA